MTRSLNEAFEKASQLPDDLQDQIAQDLLDEIEWELQWDKTLAGSEAFLEKLAKKAIGEFEAGKTQQKGIDEL